MPVVILTTEQIQAIADAVAERLAEPPNMPGRPDRLVDAATLAELLGTSRGWIYEHKHELGALRLGDGPRPRLRFDAEYAKAQWAASREGNTGVPDRSANTGRRRSRRRVTTPSSAQLLPVRGRES
jgi:hypothetical protein